MFGRLILYVPFTTKAVYDWLLSLVKLTLIGSVPHAVVLIDPVTVTIDCVEGLADDVTVDDVGGLADEPSVRK